MVSAILVAAGRGTRFGADKLLLEAAGQPIVAHTWSRLDQSPGVSEIIVVVRPGTEGVFERIAAPLQLRKPWRLAAGGEERQDSVWNGLNAISKASELVAIQDGARPCTPLDVIAATIDAARDVGAAVAAQRVVDTLKESRDGRIIDRTLDRTRIWAVQTPQAFRREIILRALAEARTRGIQLTDDTAACELIGQRVQLVEAPAPNPKVTYAGDLPYVEWLLRQKPR
jgi:2-C-methyl-D-erythritol 4-phosphate cytidylyltransferase